MADSQEKLAETLNCIEVMIAGTTAFIGDDLDGWDSTQALARVEKAVRKYGPGAKPCMPVVSPETLQDTLPGKYARAIINELYVMGWNRLAAVQPVLQPDARRRALERIRDAKDCLVKLLGGIRADYNI